ncbi:MAG TPA: FAD-dependent monooxygenase, partial [Xanthobacteraceae bacterium]|nr:FAD-dependent monooxygenase [Xanthobacteraceae bacterium]
RGVPYVLVTENLETAKHPKCNNTNARSMEHFRRLGIADELRSEGLPPGLARASAYVTRFCGYEYGRQPRPYSDWPTPELPNTVSQIVLERALKRIAEQAPGAQGHSRVHFGWRMRSFEQYHDGVTAQVESVTTGERKQIRARYLLGIDGASSTVRKALGFGMVGEDGTTQRAFMGGTMLSSFIRAPTLMAASGRTPTHMTWIINRDMRAMMYSQDGRETWVVHYQVPPGVDWRAVDARATIRSMLGADAPFEIISGGPWTGGLALVAEHYQNGRAFLAGDAAHLFTPLGGLGMNTGIGDVMNLCWKIAAAHQGWAGPRLVETYEGERRPFGVRNAQLGVECTRVMDKWLPPADCEEDGADAQAAREKFGARIMAEDRPQYLTVGLQLGERYEGSPIVWDEDTAAPPDTWDRYVPVVRAGARAPHYWVEPRKALFDLFGPGFTLLDFGADEDDRDGLANAAGTRHVPLKILQLARPGNDLYRSKLVLVRPDQHIAWHGDAAADAMAVIDRVRGA